MQTLTPATPAPPNEPRPVATLAVVAVGTLLGALAGSTVTLALPSIGRDLSVPLGLSSWVMQAYLLVVTALLLVAGRLADLWGHRAVFLLGFALFGAASIVCGVAPSFWALIAGRLLQGVGGAMFMATGPALLTTAFPAHRRGRALGLMSTATYTGLTIGPPVGGALISLAGWRAVFFINVPTAIVVVALGLLFLPRTRPSRRTPVDLVGAALLLAGLPMLLLALTQGEAWGLADFRTLGVFSLGTTLLAGFVIYERRQSSPLIDIGLFSSPRFSGATLSAIANYIALFVPIILLPFFLMEACAITPSKVGLLLAVQPVVMAAVASPAGALSDRIGTRPLAVAGMVIMGLALLGMTRVDASTSMVELALWLAMVGLGTGVFISPNSSALMGAAPAHQQGVAGGVMAVARNLGMMLGVAAATSLFHAGGGETGGLWGASEVAALHVALAVASGIAGLGALAAALGQR